MPYRIQLLDSCLPSDSHQHPNPILNSIPIQYSTASQSNTQQRTILNSVIKLVSSLRHSTASQTNTQQRPNPILNSIPVQYSTAYHNEFSVFPPTRNSIPTKYSTASQANTQQHPNPVINNIPIQYSTTGQPNTQQRAIPDAVIKLVSTSDTHQHLNPILDSLPD